MNRGTVCDLGCFFANTAVCSSSASASYGGRAPDVLLP